MLQRPGTITTGETFPSSLVTGFSNTARPDALRRSPALPGPKTTASWVLSDPVMWTSSTAGWFTR